MKKVLYVGNKLASLGKTPTTIDLLPNYLVDVCQIETVSIKRNKILRLIDMWFSIYRLRKNLDYVLIDVYSSTAYIYAITCGWLCLNLNIKYMMYAHGGNLGNRLDSRLAALHIWRNAHVRIAPSNYLKDILEPLIGREFRVINNSIDITNYPFLQREKIEPKILWVRSFSQIYNPILAIDLIKRHVEMNPHIKLTMVGPDRDGSLSICKQYVRDLKLENHVEFTGLLSKSEWISLSSKYSIFLNTTTIDNTPVSLIEALALGMIVVSSSVGGIPYLLQDNLNGFCYQSNDLEELSSILERLYNTEGKTVSLAARASVDQFTWARVKPLWEELFK